MALNLLPGFAAGTYSLVPYGSDSNSKLILYSGIGTILQGSSSSGFYYHDYDLSLAKGAGAWQLTSTLTANPNTSALATGGTWSTAGSNWTRNFVPGAGDTARFGSNLLSADTIDFGGADHTVSAVVLDNPAAGYQLGSGAANNGRLILDAGAGTATVAVASGNHIIAAPVVLNSNTDFSASPIGSSLDVVGGLSGSGNLSLSGSGDVAIVNANAAVTGGAITVNPNGTRTLGGSHATGTSLFSGPVILSNNLIVTANRGGQVQFTGNISETTPSTIIKAGLGAVSLAGSNTYSGGTTVSQGTLSAGPSSIGSGTLRLVGSTFQPAQSLAQGLLVNFYTPDAGVANLANLTL